MNPSTPDYVPSVLTSDVCNEAEFIFNTLQNKEKLVSFLDCATILRGMGMNPNQTDMERLKSLMTEPILRLEQWRREEELKREKERRREEARERKGGLMKSVSKPNSTRKSIVEKAIEASTENEKQVKIVPVEELKNIDWNIFISCTEEIYRDSLVEEKQVFDALKVFAERDSSPKLMMSQEKLVKALISNGDNVLTPVEIKQLKSLLPEQCDIVELAKRIQGTYVAPTQDELNRIALEQAKTFQIKEDNKKGALSEMNDPLYGI
ncbi:unnamed protein product [Phytomonas sp. Hart1]|nr:unnamed protein product [Phytomonas sp. Hart1]|eukprot:CCW69571.1 unnamed protein product [Phytomonas sp. isolate Hart1]